MSKKYHAFSLGPTTEIQEGLPLLNGRRPGLHEVCEIRPAKEGISVTITTAYVIGFVAGSGLIALPKVIYEAGWFGIISLPILLAVGYFTALTLSKCWMILYKNYPEYRQRIRHPYVAICYVAFGENAGHVMNAISVTMLFAVSLVVFLLISDNIRIVTVQWFDVSFCSWLPIVSLFMYPIVLLKTPVETQVFAVISLLSSIVMFCLLLVQIIVDGNGVDISVQERRHEVTFFTSTIALSTIGYSASGHACFPLYQNCMKEPLKFNRSLTIGFISICVFLASPSYISFYFLGGAIDTPGSDNLLNVLSDGVIKSFCGIALVIHFMMSYVFVLNPVCQQIEETIGIPSEYSWRLVLIRSSVVLVQLFLAASVPQFGPILSLVGACLWMPSAYVAPSIFFLRLRPLLKERHYIADSIAIHVIVIVVSSILVVCCTYSSLLAFTSSQSSFTVPCYINSTAAHI